MQTGYAPARHAEHHVRPEFATRRPCFTAPGAH